MTTDAIKLLKDVLGLPDNDRADIAARLIDSLDQRADDDAESAWDTEIARRIADMGDGSVNPIPWPEARRVILGMSDGSSNT